MVDLDKVDGAAAGPGRADLHRSQGEPLSALSRMANRDHRRSGSSRGDTVILASSMIPGNETAVHR